MGAVSCRPITRLAPGPEQVELHYDLYQCAVEHDRIMKTELAALGIYDPRGDHPKRSESGPRAIGIYVDHLGLELNWKLELAKIRGYGFAKLASAGNLKRLPRRCQEAFRLFYFMGMTHAEVAEEMGIVVGRSRVLVCEARKRLDAMRRPN